MSKKEPIYAGVNSPLIAATLAGKWQFPSREAALEKLTAMRNLFCSSKKNDCVDSVDIWVESYALTETEKKEGRCGNFIRISIKDQKKAFALLAEKLEVPTKQHPRTNRPKHRTPDWGYYVLRNVKNGKVYQTIEEANAALNALAQDFPETTRLGTAKAYTIAYSKALNPIEPLQKIVLEIQIAKEGGFMIESKPNTYEKKDKKPGNAPQSNNSGATNNQKNEPRKNHPPKNNSAPKPPKSDAPPSQPSVGKFTQMVLQRQKKKKR